MNTMTKTTTGTYPMRMIALADADGTQTQMGVRDVFDMQTITTKVLHGMRVVRRWTVLAPGAKVNGWPEDLAEAQTPNANAAHPTAIASLASALLMPSPVEVGA